MNTRTTFIAVIFLVVALAPNVPHAQNVTAGGIAPPAVPAKRTTSPSATDAKAGEGLFASMSCDGCHGGGALGWEGPSLVDGRWRYGGTDPDIFQSIFYGRPKGMPAYGGVLGTDGVWMIVSYLKAQPVPAVVPTIRYDNPSQPAAPQPDRETTPPAATNPPAKTESSADPRAKLAQYGCVACHSIDAKVVGPAFRDVAAKYQGQPDVQPRLEAKVRNGGVGVWGDVPMPPNTAVPATEVHALVTWILQSPDVRK
jgi:cytochrome c551/c552